MSDVKNVVTLGIGASPGDIHFFILVGLDTSPTAFGVDYFQRAVIDKLKADTTLTTELGGSNEIREDEWPGSDWSYPCLRIGIRDMTPSTDGKCHLTSWDVEFSVIAFTQPTVSGGIYNASSDKCADLMDYVVDALYGEELSITGRFHTETRVNVVNCLGPVPELPPGGWRGEVVFTAGVEEAR